MLFYPRLMSVISISSLFSLYSLSSQASDTHIEEVTITGIQQRFRGDVSPQEQAQSIEIISEESLENAGINQFVQAIDLSTSVSQQNNFGGLWDSFAIRGLSGDENIPSGYLINGFSVGRGFSGTRDISNVERIEIMKGPGSALYGRSEPGGTINIITKKPKFEQEGYIEVTAGSWDHYRTSGDYTNGLNDKFAFRINGAIEESDSFRDSLQSKKNVLTPSFLWLASDTLKLGYEMEYVDQESDFDRGLIAINGDPNALPNSRFLGEPNDDPTKVEVTSHQLSLQQNWEVWSLLAGLSYKDSSFVSTSSDAELAPRLQLFFSDGETLSRQRNQRDFQTTDASAFVELSGTVQTGPLNHHLLIGVDAFDFTFDKYWNRFRPAAGDDTYSINIHNPVYGQTAPEGTVINNLQENQSGYGFYLQNQIDLSEQWKILVGGRYDTFDQSIENYINSTESEQSQDTFSPRAGVVFQLSDALSFYASLSQGFRPNTGADINGEAFKPEITKSKELGVKLDGTKLSGSVALFSATKNNMLTTDIEAGASTALGKVESQGIELEVNTHLTEYTNLGFSYAYTDAKTAKEMVNTDWWVSLPKGSPLLNIPKHSANINLQQEFSQWGFNGKAGLNVRHVGERLGETIDSSYMLPSYTLVNLFSLYRFNDAISAQFNINNLLDETYAANSYSAIWTQPGSPREYKLSLKYQF